MNIYIKHFMLAIVLLVDMVSPARASDVDLINELSDLVLDYEENQTVIAIPISLYDATFFIIGGKGMPPDPGAGGNSTIEGIDSDGDGIRDDIERRISRHYINNPAARAHSYLIASHYQSIIENSTDPTLYVYAIKKMSYSEDCLDKLLPANEKKGWRLLMPWILNTVDRSKVYLVARLGFSGHRIPTMLPCI